MSEFKPVTDPDDLSLLDEEDILDGYWSGFAGAAEPGESRSRAFWHGWRNGAVDGGHRQIDWAQETLAHAVVRNRPGRVTA